MKYLPTDVSTFSTMINENYIYVDKTKYIYDLFSRGNRYYFLSRPRRFGKSLLVSTLKELFLANKELFQDLWIYTSDYNWTSHPIIYLDFSIIGHETLEDLKINLSWTLKNIAKSYKIDLEDAPTVSTQLVSLIQKLYVTNNVVILIDEYDKPLLDHINNIDKAKEFQNFLKSFYDHLKGLDQYLRAIFITGITKFSKTSIFSGINNLNDISLDENSSQLLGYTTQEIHNYFNEFINKIAVKEKSSVDQIFKELEIWYNGYRFSKENLKVYNPFSVIYFLDKQQFKNYWFESGTPSFLIKLLKNQYIYLEDIENLKISQSNLGTFEIENIPLIPILFQSGYLTIKAYDDNTQKYTLDYPNFEVEESFKLYLLAILTNSSHVKIDNAMTSIITALNNKDIQKFCSILEMLFANIPYNLHIAKESYYHSLFQFLMSLLSLQMQSEIATSLGRIDSVLFIKNYIYIFEFKYNANPDAAINQILQKKYYQKFLNLNKEIILVGIAFEQNQKSLEIKCKSQILTS